MEEAELGQLTVLATQDEALVVTAESLLQGGGIEYVVANRVFQDLVGDGRFGVNLAAGPIRIQVKPEDAEIAQNVLKDLEPAPSSLRMSLRARRVWVLLVFVLPTIFWAVCSIIKAIR